MFGIDVEQPAIGLVNITDVGIFYTIKCYVKSCNRIPYKILYKSIIYEYKSSKSNGKCYFLRSFI